MSQFFVPGEAGVASMAHVGGFVAGLLLAKLFEKRQAPAAAAVGELIGLLLWRTAFADESFVFVHENRTVALHQAGKRDLILFGKGREPALSCDENASSIGRGAGRRVADAGRYR